MPGFRIVAWALPLGLALTLVVILTRGDAPAAAGEPGGDTLATGPFPRTVELPDGGRLELAAPPERVFVANTAILDAVVALGAGARVVALPRQASTWSAIARDPQQLPNAQRFGAFIAETVLARRPDLVLCSVHSQPETVAALVELGLPVVRFGFPTSLDEVRAQLRLVGELLGADRRLAELERALDARIARLRRTPTAMFYTHDGSEGWTSGGETIVQAVLELAGLRNAVEQVGALRVTLEQILALDPDILIVPLAHGEVDVSTERMLAGPLAVLPAVRDQQVIRLHPSLFTTTSLDAITAAEEIRARITELPPIDRGAPR